MEESLQEKSFLELLKLKYQDICAYYAQKYGHPRKDYFANDSYRTISSNNQKMKEGLFLHHIDEYKVINLAQKEIAQQQPFSYQKKERLIYCNYLERLLLYIKIFKYNAQQKNKNTKLIADKISNSIISEINDIFSGMKYESLAKNYAIQAIVKQKENYLVLLDYLINKTSFDKPLLTSYNLQNNKHFLINNLKIYEEIINLGLDLENEYQIWTDFFYSTIRYANGMQDVNPFLDWFWIHFYSQIKRSTTKEDVFKDFTWKLTAFFLMQHEETVWHNIIDIMFGKYNDARDEMKIPVINQISNDVYKDMRSQGGWYSESYEKEKEHFFAYLAEQDKEAEITNGEKSLLEKEMLFLADLIRRLIHLLHHVQI